MSIFFPTIWQKIQKTTGSYVNGVWIEGTSTTTDLVADIQPLSGEEAETLSIGNRNIGKIKIYTNEDLNITDEINNQSGDIVIWNNENYEIIEKQIRNGGLIDSIKYIGELRKNDN